MGSNKLPNASNFYEMRKKLQKLIFASFAFAICFGVSAQQTASEIDAKVDHMLKRMTLEEKVDYISGMRIGGHGPNKWDGTKENKRLGIEPIKIYHGPYGIGALRYVKKNGTYYPSSINMACTWNPELVQEVATSMGKELKAAGGQSNAGPAMNIIRDLRGGRSMEYFTEDPYLNGQIAAAYVKGIQSPGNFAIMKHFICNNQERERNYMDVNVGERALREIYLPGYKQAVIDGGVLGVMTGYNTVNSSHSSANKHLIQDILKDEWGFKGIVMTDWSGSDDDAAQMLNAGLDLEMPRPKTLTSANVLKALKQGEISEAEIDEKVRRILYVSYFTGVMDAKPEIRPEEMATPETIELARKMAEEAIVLLKNDDDILPLDRGKVKSIAVIGPNGEFGAHFRNGQKSYQLLQGGGSASISPQQGRMITPFAGIKNASRGIEVTFEPGCYGDHGCTTIQPEFFTTTDNKPGLEAKYYANSNLKGKPNVKVDKNIRFFWQKTPEIIEQGNDKQNGSEDGFSVEWTGKLKAPISRKYTFEVEAQGLTKVFIDGKLVLDKTKPDVGWDRYAMGSAYLEQGNHDIKVEFRKSASRNQLHLMWDYGNDVYLDKAIELAKKSDVVIMPIGTSGSLEREAVDRDEKLNRSESLALSAAQERLIKEVSRVNKNVVVVTFTAGVVCEQWKNNVSAILYAGFPGQEGGNALASILFGDVNPSAKLTVSIPKSVSQFPDKWYSNKETISYDEGIYVGYRFFDKYKKEPAFPFGHGLSYSQFNYGKPNLSAKAKIGEVVKLKVPLSNMGTIAGKEVVQVYVRDKKSSEPRPLKELKAFKKVQLAPNETKVIDIELAPESFSFFSENENKWITEAGGFEIWIGSSSADIRQKVKLELVK